MLRSRRGINYLGADYMLLKRQLCSACKVGQESYKLDSKSLFCPHMGCWNHNKCSAFVPVEKVKKTDD